MDFFNKLLNRPTPKPAICHASLQQQQSSEEAQLSRWFSAEGQTLPAQDRQQQQQQQQQPAPNKRESGEAATTGSGPGSLSSASSFQSLASSSLSSKSSSGICADSAPGSPEQHGPALGSPRPPRDFDRSYANAGGSGDLSGLDGLIAACANIDLNSSDAGPPVDDEHEPSFASAADDTLDAADATQLLHSDEQQPAEAAHPEPADQTHAFRTCPDLPQHQISQVAREGNRPQEHKASAALSDESTLSSSSGEPTVLRTSTKSEQSAAAPLDAGAGAEFKTALGSFAPVHGTPVQARANPEAISTFSGCNAPQNKFEHDSSDVSFAEVENFNIPDESKLAAQGETKNTAGPNASENLNLSVSKEIWDSACSQSVTSTSPQKIVDQATQPVSPSKAQSLSSSDDRIYKNSEPTTTRENGGLARTGLISGKDSNKTTSVLNTTTTVDQIQDTVEKENPSSSNQIVRDQGKALNKTQDIQESNLQNKSIECEAITRVPHNGITTRSESYTEENGQLGPSHQTALKDQSIRLNSESDQRDADSTRDRINKSFHESSPTKKLSSVSITEDYYPPNSLNSGVVASTPLLVKNSAKKTPPQSPKIKGALFSQEPNVPFKDKDLSSSKEERLGLDKTAIINESSEKSSEVLEIVNKENLEATEILHNSLNLLPNQEPDYEAFKPQQQSTTLPLPNHCEFEVLEDAALNVPKDIESSFKIEENEQFVSATTDLFGDPAAFDFLDQAGSRNCQRGERYDSLYMRFDPLAERASMLPQKNVPNSPAVEEEEIEKNTRTEIPVVDINTPKKNPALAAIDRLLFYSPMSQSVTPESKTPEAKEEKEEAEKEEPPAVPVVDEKMAKELELVRSTMLQLEEDLRLNREQSEKQKLAYEEKMNQLQIKLTQEVKCKEQMTVVVEEYEKSISRLIAEREKDRNNFEVEKAKLQEELQVANQHLSNTEAAFSDVHTKYERLKNVISAYKSNEAVLKDSIIENQETIKTLENRYEQLKSHAMAQLEKANLELSAIKKQNEAETVKLKAMVRKAELKSKSLEETVEQKTKENKELTQIIDEMIARVE